MNALDDASREHEQYRLRLRPAKEIEVELAWRPAPDSGRGCLCLGRFQKTSTPGAKHFSPARPPGDRAGAGAGGQHRMERVGEHQQEGLGLFAEGIVYDRDGAGRDFTWAAACS